VAWTSAHIVADTGGGFGQLVVPKGIPLSKISIMPP
jgi:hypothetical protein